MSAITYDAITPPRLRSFTGAAIRCLLMMRRYDAILCHRYAVACHSYATMMQPLYYGHDACCFDAAHQILLADFHCFLLAIDVFRCLRFTLAVTLDYAIFLHFHLPAPRVLSLTPFSLLMPPTATLLPSLRWSPFSGFHATPSPAARHYHATVAMLCWLLYFCRSGISTYRQADAIDIISAVTHAASADYATDD